MRKIEATQKERERRSGELSSRSSGGIRDVVPLLRDVRIATCTAVLVVGLASLYGYVFFSPLILRDDDSKKKRSMVLISFLDFIPASLSMLINWLCSWISDRTGERLMIAVLGFGVQALAMCLAAAFIHAPFAVLYFFYNMFNVGFIVYDTMQRSYQADIMPKSVSAAGFALVNGIGAFGGFIGRTSHGRGAPPGAPAAPTRTMTAASSGGTHPSHAPSPSLSRPSAVPRTNTATMMGSLHGTTDSYAIPLLVLAVLSALSGGVLLLLKVLKERESPLDFFRGIGAAARGAAKRPRGAGAM